MVYTGSMKVEVPRDSEALDVYTMRQMSEESYETYVSAELLLIDHRTVLRAVHGDYPIATTPQQISLLISYLQKVQALMAASGLPIRP